MKTKLFALGLLTVPNVALAVDHYLEMQSGAMQGLMHLSYGITFSNKHSLSMGVGFVPELDFHEEMTLTSYRYRYEGEKRVPFSLGSQELLFSPYNFGVTLISGHQDEIYASTPDYIPSGYYMPTARRVLFNYQPNLRLGKHLQAYLDLTMLDVGLINYARNFDFYRSNYDFFGLEGVVTYGFGVRTIF